MAYPTGERGQELLKDLFSDGLTIKNLKKYFEKDLDGARAAINFRNELAEYLKDVDTGQTVADSDGFGPYVEILEEEAGRLRGEAEKLNTEAAELNALYAPGEIAPGEMVEDAPEPKKAKRGYKKGKKGKAGKKPGKKPAGKKGTRKSSYTVEEFQKETGLNQRYTNRLIDGGTIEVNKDGTLAGKSVKTYYKMLENYSYLDDHADKLQKEAKVGKAAFTTKRGELAEAGLIVNVGGERTQTLYLFKDSKRGKLVEALGGKAAAPKKAGKKPKGKPGRKPGKKPAAKPAGKKGSGVSWDDIEKKTGIPKRTISKLVVAGYMEKAGDGEVTKDSYKDFTSEYKTLGQAAGELKKKTGKSMTTTMRTKLIGEGLLEFAGEGSQGVTILKKGSEKDIIKMMKGGASSKKNSK